MMKNISSVKSYGNLRVRLRLSIIVRDQNLHENICCNLQLLRRTFAIANKQTLPSVISTVEHKLRVINFGLEEEKYGLIENWHTHPYKHCTVANPLGANGDKERFCFALFIPSVCVVFKIITVKVNYRLGLK